ncbi:MAG: virulence protein [Acetivibrio ethanolgignens]
MMIYYDLTGAARKDLVKKIEELTGEKAKYLGVSSCAYKIGDYEVSKDGTLSWPDLNDADMGFLSKRELLIERLCDAGFEATFPGYEEDEENTAEGEQGKDYGLSITIPFDSVAVGNLTNLLESKGELIKRALGINDIRIEMNEDSVTFPWFESAAPEDMKAYTEFIAALCKMTKEQKRISSKQKGIVNEKYEFRCFLLRLGFIGDEFKTTRKILMRNLTGSAAFKNGGEK